MAYSRVVSVVLVLSGVGLVLRSRYGMSDKKRVALFQVSEMSAG